MCQVAFLECYGPGRVISRELDQPQSVYFILSGAVMAVSSSDRWLAGELKMFTRGMSFGEKAVCTDTRNGATLCTKTDVELLRIYGPDFKRIHIACKHTVLGSAKQEALIRNVAFLRHWPVERLIGNSQTCAVQNFDRNQVVVKDSNDSDKIYIVLKGSLSVMKKMKRVEPSITRKGRTVSLRELAQGYIARRKRIRQIGFWQRNGGSDHDAGDVSLGKQDRLLSNIQEAYKSVQELEITTRQTLPGYQSQADRCGCLDYQHIVNNFNSRLITTGQDGAFFAGSDPENCSPPNEAISTNCACQQGPTLKDSLDNHNLPAGGNPSTQPCSLPSIATNNYVIHNGQGTSGGHPQAIDTITNQKKEEYQTYPKTLPETLCYNKEMQSRKCIKAKTLSKSLKGGYLTPSSIHGEESDVDTRSPDVEPQITHNATVVRGFQTENPRRVLGRQRRERVARELDKKHRSGIPTEEPGHDPMVVQLQVLERGEYFGVTTSLFPDPPKLSVVSNGAECLVLSKKLFLQWASEKCLRHLRQTERPYPSDAELHRKLQEVVNWQSIRAAIYHQAVSQANRRKENRKQLALAYRGC